ncbi:MAG: GntR family transcriptional regulator [Pseudomonadota bacterium]
MDNAAHIDRETFEPAYLQLVNILRDQVADGTYRPGSQLPSESQLCERYRVSPMTVRRTIKILLDQGVVTTVKGSGTFVQPIALGAGTFRLEELQSLFRGKEETKVKLLEVRIVRADEPAARKLAVALGERIILIRRVLIQKGTPLLYHQEYLIYDPTRPIVEAEMEVTSLYGLFSGAGGTDLKRGDLAIDAVALDKEQARLLEAPEMLPAFCLEHLFYDFDDRPVSWGRFVCRGDRLRFTTTVGISKKS